MIKMIEEKLVDVDFPNRVALKENKFVCHIFWYNEHLLDVDDFFFKDISGRLFIFAFTSGAVQCKLNYWNNPKQNRFNKKKKNYSLSIEHFVPNFPLCILYVCLVLINNFIKWINISRQSSTYIEYTLKCKFRKWHVLNISLFE